MIELVYNPEEIALENIETLADRNYISYGESSFHVGQKKEIYFNLFRADADSILIQMNKDEQRLVPLQETMRTVFEYQDSCDFILIFSDKSYEKIQDSTMRFHTTEATKNEERKEIGF